MNEKSAVPDLAEFSFSRSSEIGLDAVALSRNIDDRRRIRDSRACRSMPAVGAAKTRARQRGRRSDKDAKFCSERPMEGDRLGTDRFF